MMVVVHLLVVAALTAEAVLCVQLFKDPDFEESNPYNQWSCAGCHLSRDTDHTQGRHSVKVTNRQADWAGPMQTVALLNNHRYYYKAHVKQLNDIPGTMFQKFSVLLDIHKNDGSHEYQTIMDYQSMRTQLGWTVMSVYFMFKATDYQQVDLRVEGPAPAVQFLMDDVSLTDIPEDTNWKSEANARIDQLRKSNIHFNVHLPHQVSSADFDIQIDLVKHSFPFGSQTSTRVLTQNPQYAKLFYYMFNYATLNDFYWFLNPSPRHNPDYSNSAKTLNLLHQHGISVRGHNIFWGTQPKLTPDWVRSLNATQLKHAVDERIQYIVKDTKGIIQHWDVNNELVHGHWFEEQTGDPDFTQKIFAKIHQADPNVKLFLNDYSVVARGNATSAYLAQAEEFKSANVGLYGLGVQCHFPEYVPPDPTLMLKRLDQLGAVGLPLWVTEMDLLSRDENTRAGYYETALRVLFSHPSVEGIILWGFWDKDHWRGPDAALVSGSRYYVNAAGKRYINLIYNEWSTHAHHKVSTGKQFRLRGFHGNYNVVVKYRGAPVMQQQFTLGKQDKHVDIKITDINHVLHLTTTSSPLLYNGNVMPHTVAHINGHSLGHMTSGSSDHLTCMTRYSGISQVRDDAFAEVGCPSGYVLTGCSGTIKDNRSTKDGELIVIQTGSGAKCRAYDAGDSAAPVQAVARCCKLSGLICDYRKSGPSQAILNQRLETRCHNNMYATGCTAHSYFESFDGAFPTTHACVAQNDQTKGGVEAFAACCSAPRMTCQLKESSPAGNRLGNVTKVACDPGWHMLGCSEFSEDAGLGGAYIAGSPDECIAVNGKERLYYDFPVKGYAVCCRVH